MLLIIEYSAKITIRPSLEIPMNYKKGDLLINRHDYKKTIRIKDITDLSVVSDEPKQLPISLDYIKNQYLVFEPVSLDPIKKDTLTKESLKIGMELEPYFKNRHSEERRKITHIGDDYYLYINSDPSNQKEKPQETRGDYEQLSRLTIYNPIQNSNKKLTEAINSYKTERNELKDQLQKIIPKFNDLLILQNEKINHSLSKALAISEFTAMESFCLKNNIPLPLSIEKVNHLKNSGVPLKETQGEQISVPMMMDQEVQYETLYQVRYFTAKDLKQEILTLLDNLI